MRQKVSHVKVEFGSRNSPHRTRDPHSLQYSFVEQEVSRVKVMFEAKEGRLRSERDAARRQLEATEAARDALEAQVGAPPPPPMRALFAVSLWCSRV